MNPSARFVALTGRAARSAGVILWCTTLGGGCGDRGETQLRALLTEYVRLQGAHIAENATYASTAPEGLAVPADVELQLLGASADGHAALAFRTADRQFVCAVRVGGVQWGVGAVPSNGQPLCGRREVVLQPPVADTAPATQVTEATPTPAPRVPPAYARYFPLIARRAELQLDDPAERAEIVLAITHALTHPAEELEPLTVFDQDLQPTLNPPGAGRHFGEPGAAGWRVEPLRTQARGLIRRLEDPSLLPILIHSLISADDGRKGEFESIQNMLVSATGVDTAPFYVVSTAENRRAAEAFWLKWWADTGPRPFATDQQALRARRHWQRTVQLRAWAADPPSWSEVLRWGVIPSLDSVTNAAVRDVALTLLTVAPDTVAQRTGRIPSEIADLRTRAARYVRMTQDTTSVPALITALTLPDPDLYLERHDSVFLELQETLVTITAADTAPRYAMGSAENREAAAAFWREWWRTSDGRVRFLGAIEAQQAVRRWEMFGRQYAPTEWLDLLTRSSAAGDAEIARVIRSVAMEIVTLPFDSLVQVSSWDRSPEGIARELRERATYRLRVDFDRDVVAALILGLERGPTAELRVDAVNEAEVFYRMQEALVRQIGVTDAPYFALPSRATRDSAVVYWRTLWSADAAAWQPPTRARAAAVAAAWAANRAAPVLRADPVLWYTMLTSLPLGAREVQQTLRPVVLEVLTIEQDSLEDLLVELRSPRATEIALSLGFHAVMFARVYPHETFVTPLIERLLRPGGTGAVASQRFEQIQMALVATSGLASAPRRTGARRESRRTVQRYWRDWWSDNETGFTPADSAVAVDAVHTWLNKPPR